MDDQYEVINPPGAAPPPPPVAANPPPPAPSGPDATGSTLLQTKTDLKSTELKVSADPSAMPEAQDFGGGQSAYTSPVPPVDSKSQKDTVTEKPGKKRSVMWTAIFGGLSAVFLIIAVVGGLGAAKVF